MQTKQALRDWARQTRSGLPITTISQQIITSLQNWDVYQKANHILSYLAFGDEINLDLLHQDSSKAFYVTRTHKTHLTIHPLLNLERHPFGYLQPSKATPATPPERIDLALVPGLCFDTQGFRLGYGKGYYDKLLPTLRAIPFAGITAEGLTIEHLPSESFDVPMTYLVTETGIRKC